MDFADLACLADGSSNLTDFTIKALQSEVLMIQSRLDRLEDVKCLHPAEQVKLSQTSGEVEVTIDDLRYEMQAQEERIVTTERSLSYLQEGLSSVNKFLGICNPLNSNIESLASESWMASKLALEPWVGWREYLADLPLAPYDVYEVSASMAKPPSASCRPTFFDGNLAPRGALLEIRDAIDDGPGMYRIVAGFGTKVRLAAEMDSPFLELIAFDTEVEVFEVLMLEGVSRVRAKIKKPAGWITVLDTETDTRMAVKQSEVSMQSREIGRRVTSGFVCSRNVCGGAWLNPIVRRCFTV